VWLLFINPPLGEINTAYLPRSFTNIYLSKLIIASYDDFNGGLNNSFTVLVTFNGPNLPNTFNDKALLSVDL
jgi:hypothetical protein